MIVLLNMTDGTTEKAFVRDKIFTKVDKDNKKIREEQLSSKNIKSVMWIESGTYIEIPIKQWITDMEDCDYLNITD